MVRLRSWADARPLSLRCLCRGELASAQGEEARNAVESIAISSRAHTTPAVAANEPDSTTPDGRSLSNLPWTCLHLRESIAEGAQATGAVSFRTGRGKRSAHTVRYIRLLP